MSKGKLPLDLKSLMEPPPTDYLRQEPSIEKNIPLTSKSEEPEEIELSKEPEELKVSEEPIELKVAEPKTPPVIKPNDKLPTAKAPKLETTLEAQKLLIQQVYRETDSKSSSFGHYLPRNLVAAFLVLCRSENTTVSKDLKGYMEKRLKPYIE